MTELYKVDKGIYWTYVQQEAPPTGVKLFLLTEGGVAVVGDYTNDGRYIAWRGLFRRDHAYEDSLK